MKRMLCVYFLVLGLILSWSLVYAEPKKRWIKIEIDFDSGETFQIKPHSQGHSSEKELSHQEIAQLLRGQYSHIGQLLYTHQSPGCVTYILGGRAVKICY